MISILCSEDRGASKFDWLDSKHSFSFGSYHDPERMGFRSLRVINDDHVAPGQGFDTHGHKDMEIISYVLSGALEHKDSLGTGSVIKPGEVQRMSAGSGIRHSEFNHSQTEGVHFLQIWILPEAQNMEPGYEQKAFAPETLKGGFKLVGDRHGTDGAVTIHQDVKMLVALLDSAQEISYVFENGRGGYLHVARGKIMMNGEILSEGDGAEIEDISEILVKAEENSELILFDLG